MPSELRSGIAAGGFPGQERRPKNDKKSSCLVSIIRCLSCHIDGATKIKLISGNNFFSGKNPQFEFF